MRLLRSFGEYVCLREPERLPTLAMIPSEAPTPLTVARLSVYKKAMFGRMEQIWARPGQREFKVGRGNIRKDSQTVRSGCGVSNGG
jgi:hypothetical protein